MDLSQQTNLRYFLTDRRTTNGHVCSVRLYANALRNGQTTDSRLLRLSVCPSRLPSVWVLFYSCFFSSRWVYLVLDVASSTATSPFLDRFGGQCLGFSQGVLPLAARAVFLFGRHMPYYKKRFNQFKRKYIGMIPNESKYIQLRQRLSDKNPGVYWRIFMRNDFKSGDAWLNLKIKLDASLTDRKMRKSIYWIAYNLDEDFFAVNDDLRIIQKYEHELFVQILHFIPSVYWDNYC